MAVYAIKSDNGVFLGWAYDATNSCMYFTPDKASAAAYYPMERPFQVCSRAITLAANADIASETIWMNKTGRTVQVKAITIRQTGKGGAGSILELKKVPSGTAFGSGVSLLSGANYDTADCTNDTNNNLSLTSTGADLLLGDGDSIQFAITNDADGANTNLVIVVALAPYKAAVTFPNAP